MDIPDRITFQTDDRVRAALEIAADSYEGRPLPSLSALVREAMIAGCPLVAATQQPAAPRPRRARKDQEAT